MNEERTKQKKSATKNADKLKNNSKASQYAASKFRTGKKDNSLTLEEMKELARIRKQGRKAAQKVAAEQGLVKVISSVHDAAEGESKSGGEDQNVGAQSLEGAVSATSTALVYAEKLQKYNYSKKQTAKKILQHKAEDKAVQKSDSNPQSKVRQKSQIKKELQRKNQQRSAKEAANQVGDISKKFVDKAEDLTGKLAEFIEEHFQEVATILIVFVLILLVASMFSSCGAAFNGTSHVGITTSYTADDEDIYAVEDDYREMEEELQDIGVSSIEVIGQDYKRVEEQLEDAGFSYVVSYQMYDLDYSERNKEGTIGKIEVDGDETFSSLARYDKDVDIVIEYHSLKNEYPPMTSKEAKKQNYNDVVTQFKNAGFGNIKLVQEKDLITGWITKDGSVESVSINGDVKYKTTSSFRVDAEITITYHTFKDK